MLDRLRGALAGCVLVVCVTIEARAFAEPDHAPSIETRGCCSHHKGVCGCKDNVVQCCDGSASPTCTC
jgi:hypothetical protein